MVSTANGLSYAEVLVEPRIVPSTVAASAGSSSATVRRLSCGSGSGHRFMVNPKSRNRVVKLFHRLRRRRATPGCSGNKVSGKPYVIPTGSKGKSADHHGYSALEWNTMNKNPVGEELIQLPSDLKESGHRLIFKSASEPCHQDDDHNKKDRKQVTRTMTQPTGTTTYTVQSSDTLTGLAARFDTTPSELVKLNRLASRFIFPGQVLFVPVKNFDIFEESSVEGGLPDAQQTDQDDQSPVIQKSPKPGHVERIQSPPSSPTAPLTLTEDEERNLDRECIERFLKINVRHITDGQGVVTGVLLVTPNAIMFDPNVSDPLVIEHGAEKYGVIAPMDYVVNAAMYNDIATMFVSHAPNSTAVHSPPQVYHATECPLTWPMNNLDTMTSTRPARSDSEQAVRGSTSDAPDAITPDDDRASNTGSGLPYLSTSTRVSDVRPMSTSDSTSNLDSEVFMEEGTENKSNVNQETETPAATQTEEEKGSLVEVDATVHAQDTDSTITIVHNATSSTEQREDKPETAVGQTSTAEPSQTTNNVPASDPAVSDANDPATGDTRLPLSDQPVQQPAVTAAATPPEQVLKESLLRRKNSTLENKMKVLKQLSYPLTWMESIGGSEKDKENAPPLTTLPEVATTSGGSATQSTFSKLLSSASPKNLVDFSSGLFTKASEDGSREEVPLTTTTSKRANARPSSLHENMVTGNSVFYDESRRSSAEKKADIGAGLTVAKRRTPTADIRPHSTGDAREPKVGFKSVVSVDDMPDLFASIDQLIPRPAKPCDDPPLYLCLRMGKPLNKKILKATPIMAYGKKRMKREYWFSIPRDRVDDLYSFFNHWAPNVYGDLDEEAIRKYGYELVTSEEELSEDEHRDRRESAEGSTSQQSADDDLINNAHTDWEILKAPHMKFFSRLRSQVRASIDTEVVSVSELKKQMSLEVECALPDLIGETEILEEEHRKVLSKHLPARAVSYAWSLIFSSSQHGFSLKSLYRKMANYDTPILLVIMDSDNNVFGAVTSCALKISEHFYGTGESFLFTFSPEFEIFRWTGENEYCIKGNTESLAIGAGDGVFGLWLDGDLYHGRSHPCKTYNNKTLSSKEDFCIKTLEAWGFVEVDTTNA